ncbi:hypothetical protein B7486_13420 [cyanobacterium TDX16]|nr:hypothetical protein B7486_13420 [cyanobacterium TDX16]
MESEIRGSEAPSMRPRPDQVADLAELARSAMQRTLRIRLGVSTAGRKMQDKPAAAKRAKYLAERLRGVGRVNAVRNAGYDPGNRRAAHSIANKIEKQLQRDGQVEQAMIDVGFTLREAAVAFKRNLNSRDSRVALETLKLLGRILGWER